MLPHTIQYDLSQLAKNAPLNGYIYSTQYPVQMIKENYSVDDEKVCKTLQELKREGYIREFDIRYSQYNEKHIDMYWFR